MMLDEAVYSPHLIDQRGRLETFHSVPSLLSLSYSPGQISASNWMLCPPAVFLR